MEIMKAVLFDLDGTLLDRDASLRQFVAAQYQRFQTYLKDIPADEYLSRFIELDCRGHVWKDKVYQQLVSEYSISGLGWRQLLEDYEILFMQYCVPFPNLFLMLDTLQERKYSLGLLTNGLGTFQTRAIQGLGIEQYFDTILISETEGIKKPDIQTFQRALDNLRVEASASVFVGDHPQTDIAGAKCAGMKTIWKKDLYWPIAFEADATIEDLAEIPAVIQSF
ncbi:MAG: putative hydrolase of the superfamily [Abditibacteriota bacterium]|nr:putative hydrolase of the superfamily [Abditibacteriota bacterium]